MGDLDQPHFFFAILVVSFTLGATAIVALVTENRYTRILLAGVFCLMGVSLFNASATDYAVMGFRGSNLLVLAILVAATLVGMRKLFAHFQFQSDKLRHILIPHLWDQADPTPSSITDLSKRWFVAVAGAAGSVVGVVMSDAKICDAFASAFSATQIFYTIFLAVVSVTLIGPGEELAMGVGRKASDGEGHEPASLVEELFARVSPKSFGVLLLVAAIWLALNVFHKCMDETLSEGQLTTAYVMLFGCFPMGVVTYYWCAALQRDVPSVARTSAIAASVAMAFLLTPYMITGFLAGLYNGIFVMAPYIPSFMGTGQLGMLVIFIAVILAIAAALFFSALFYGGLAWLGGRVLDVDKNRPERASVLTIVRIIVRLMLWSGFLALLIFLAVEKTWNWPWGIKNFSFLAGHVIWGAGLWVSNFPKIVEHARARSLGGTAQTRGGAQTA